jgi:hypothetical protein
MPRIVPVIGLLFGGGPSDVAGFVVPLVVRPTINGVLRGRPGADMGKERSKIGVPLSTYADTFGGIESIVRVACRSAATFSHAAPSTVLRRAGSAVRAPEYSTGAYLILIAAARYSVTVSEVLTNHMGYLPAVALTTPIALEMVSFWIQADYQQAPEALSQQIDRTFRHLHKAVTIAHNGYDRQLICAN